MRPAIHLPFRVGFCALILILLVSSPQAQTTTGKIAGRITDAHTGEPLPGANIVLIGTRRGATADANGDYFILRLSPGIYEARASLIGYLPVTQTAVGVRVDRTTPLDFALQESSVDLSEIVVVAHRPPVEMDVSHAQTILSPAEIEAPPVGPRLREAFATHVGVDTDAWGLTIRGGNEEEILYMVDGVGLKDNRNSRSYSAYSKTAVQEVQILTGGFNAEYGDVRSGVVNVVNREPRTWTSMADFRYSPAGKKHFGPETYAEDNWWDVGRFLSMAPTEDHDKDGKPDFEGWQQTFEKRGGPRGRFKAGIFKDPISTPEQARAIWDWQHRPIPENNFQNVNPSDRNGDYAYDLTLGGPLVKDRLAFLLSYRRERTAYTWSAAAPNFRDNTWLARLTVLPTPTSKLSFGFIRGWDQGTKRGNFLGEFVRSPRGEVPLLRARNIFAMGSETNIETISRRYGTLTWSHTLSPRSFYNITLRTGKTNWLASWQKIQKVDVPAAAVYPDGRTEAITETDVAAARASGAVILDEAPRGFRYRPRAQDILGMYRLRGTSGGGRSGDWSWIRETDLTADITAQITTNHQLKAGLQLHHFYLRELRGYIADILNPDREASNFLPENFDDPIHLAVTGPGGADDTADLHNYWVKFPFYGGFFLQDRMEYRQIVVNAGLRLDFHRPDKYFDLPNEQHAQWMRAIDGPGSPLAIELYTKARAVQPPTKFALSPRFGVSHPITAESKLFFNYGHFYQVPTSDQLYRTQSGLNESTERLGNPWMDMPRTIAYEVGYERNIASQYLLNTTVFYKDIENEVNVDGRLAATNAPFAGMRFSTNGEVRDVRGIELSLRKAKGKYLSGFTSYEFRAERRNLVGWRFLYDIAETDRTSQRFVEADPRSVAPRSKARPILKAGLNLRTPIDYGSASRHALGGWEANLYYRRQAGLWFSYNPLNDSALQDVDNAQWIDLSRLDLRLSKTFDIRGTPTFYLEVSNLLNSKIVNTNVSRVFESVRGPRASQSFARYMEALGWTLDQNGILRKGNRPGKEAAPEAMPRRTYLFYYGRRDVAFGARFSF